MYPKVPLLIIEGKKTASNSSKSFELPCLWDVGAVTIASLYGICAQKCLLSYIFYIFNKLHNCSAIWYFYLNFPQKFVLLFQGIKLRKCWWEWFSVNRRSRIYAQKHKTFEKQMLKTRVENVNFIQDGFMWLKVTPMLVWTFPKTNTLFVFFNRTKGGTLQLACYSELICEWPAP